jgi:hypothetical protein
MPLRHRKKREPEVKELDGGFLVKHCDDAELAAALVRKWAGENDVRIDPREGKVIWCRILGRLPGSLAEAEGWAWEYRYAEGPGRGVFRAVEFVQ